MARQEKSLSQELRSRRGINAHNQASSADSSSDWESSTSGVYTGSKSKRQEQFLEQQRKHFSVSNSFQLLQSQSFSIIFNQNELEAQQFTNDVLIKGLRDRNLAYSTTKSFMPGLRLVDNANHFIEKSSFILIVVSEKLSEDEMVVHMVSTAFHRSIEHRRSCFVVPIVIAKDYKAIPVELRHLTAIIYDERDPDKSVFEPLEMLLNSIADPTEMRLQTSQSRSKKERNAQAAHNEPELESGEATGKISLQSAASFHRPPASLPVKKRQHRRSRKREHQMPQSEEVAHLTNATDSQEEFNIRSMPHSSRHPSALNIFLLYDKHHSTSQKFVRREVYDVLSRHIAVRDKEHVKTKASVQFNEYDGNRQLLSCESRKLFQATNDTLEQCIAAIIVVTSDGNNLSSELDKITLHSIGYRFESGKLHVFCVRITENGIVPTQIRGALIADYFSSDVKEIWPQPLFVFFRSTGFSPSPHLQSEPHAETDTSDLHLYHQLDVRCLRVHRVLHQVSGSLFTPVVIILFMFQLIIGLIVPYFSIFGNVSAGAFLSVIIHVFLRAGLPIVMMSKLRECTMAASSSLIINFQKQHVPQVRELLNGVYQEIELQDVNVNNIIRFIETKFDKALFTTVYHTIMHNFLVVLALCLIGALNYSAYDYWTGSTRESYKFMMKTLLIEGDFSLVVMLSLIGFVNALFVHETKLIMYCKRLCHAFNLSRGLFMQQYSTIKKMWTKFTVCATAFVFVVMLMYFIAPQGTLLPINMKKEDKLFWNVSLIFLFVSELFALCPSAWFLLYFSLLVDGCMILVLIIWKYANGYGEDVIRESHRFQFLNACFFLILVLRVASLLTRKIGGIIHCGQWNELASISSVFRTFLTLCIGVVLVSLCFALF